MRLKDCFVLLCIALVGCHSGVATNCLTKFDVKTIRQGDTVCLYGKLHNHLEDVALWQIGFDRQAVWLSASDSIPLETLSDKKVEVKGIVDYSNKGHLGGYLYSLAVLEIREH
ncbi:MAG: hypothetical protein EOP49_38565 [Sphingobacteriales bacterium]|nr:MAG: hypothetical protein EOP49_38565 [Sphingobacteriales bacterium]